MVIKMISIRTKKGNLKIAKNQDHTLHPQVQTKEATEATANQIKV